MRALGASPWVCLSVRALVHSQGNDVASGVLLVAKFQSPLSWEELCGASLYQLREEGLLVRQLPKASLNSCTQVWLRLVSGLRGGGAGTESEDQMLINYTQKGLGSDRTSYGRKTRKTFL